jgi:hypothetical protein
MTPTARRRRTRWHYPVGELMLEDRAGEFRPAVLGRRFSLPVSAPAPGGAAAASARGTADLPPRGAGASLVSSALAPTIPGRPGRRTGRCPDGWPRDTSRRVGTCHARFDAPSHFAHENVRRLLAAAGAADGRRASEGLAAQRSRVRPPRAPVRAETVGVIYDEEEGVPFKKDDRHTDAVADIGSNPESPSPSGRPGRSFPGALASVAGRS